MSSAQRIGGGPGSGDKMYPIRSGVDSAERLLETLKAGITDPAHGQECLGHLRRLRDVGDKAAKLLGENDVTRQDQLAKVAVRHKQIAGGRLA